MRLQLLTASVIYIFAGPNQFYHIFSNALKIQRLHEFLWLLNHSQAEMETKSIPQSLGHSLGIPFLKNLLNSFLNPWILLISTAPCCKDNDYNATEFTGILLASLFFIDHALSAQSLYVRQIVLKEYLFIISLQQFSFCFLILKSIFNLLTKMKIMNNFKILSTATNI